MSPWVPYSPGKRVYSDLSAELKRQLHQIIPSGAPELLYYPCAVTMRDGKVFDRVYVMNAQMYIDAWGAWPEHDPAKSLIDITHVVRIEESSYRLPPDIANRILEAGESGMGYCIFTILFHDGSHKTYCSGNAVDFVEFPVGKTGRDVIEVIPHRGDEQPNKTPPYYWCLFGKGISNRRSMRWEAD